MTQFDLLSKNKRSEIEIEILKTWKENNIFQAGEKKNQDGESFVFFEGPPTTNGLPGIHHVLARVFKDIYVRFQMLQGKHVPRRAGWDCHGLPVEREVEKQLGIKTKSEIETGIGIAEFNQKCRESVLKYIGEWDQFTERMAFWVDLDKPYFTMDNSYIESVWSLLKIIWDKGLIYEGYKVVPCDPILGATMSDAEVDQGYKDTEDPSVTVAFRLKANDFIKQDASILVWTTTPWTLPSNVALALNAGVDYVLAEVIQDKKKHHFVFAQDLLNSVLLKKPDKKNPDKNEIYAHKILKKFKGKKLEGLYYEQLLDHIPQKDFSIHKESNSGLDSCKIICADFVTTDSGTGIVHIAPAYGADDLQVGIDNKLAVVHAVGLDGNFIAGTPCAGKFFKDADKEIIKELKLSNKLWKNERYKHSYPFGYRTGAPLLYYAKNAWYIRTTDIRDELLANNSTINWVPDYIKDGRFGNWLSSNRDWALSRERYWGTPLPVWTDGEGNYKIIGSVGELEKLSQKKLQGMDLHRPHIDEITFEDPVTGNTMKRIPEVIDCWFDSGSMPYAQWGWPVDGKKKFEKYFPADFISEAIDQTRGWFYTLLCVSTMVSGKASYKNVVCLGHVLDEKGEKMSKSKGNIVKPNDVFDIHGADAIRWYFLTQSPAGNSRRVGQPGSKNDPVSIVHGFFNMLLNSLSFFVLYANVDQVQLINNNTPIPGVKGALDFSKRQKMDRWILSALEQLIEDVSDSLNKYDCMIAGQKIEIFTDSLSNWYIRRNRRRFWKGELDSDKKSAYDTLYHCLHVLARLVAPFTPFLAEQVYSVLIPVELRKKFPVSVHLCDWPKPDKKNNFDHQVLSDGETVKQVAYLGRSARMLSGIKVRQPLEKIMIYVEGKQKQEAILGYRDALKEEINIKNIEFIVDTQGILEYQIKPNLPRIGKKLGPKIKIIQNYINNCDHASLSRQIKDNKSILIQDPLGDIELEPDDFIVESVSSPGTSGVEANGILVALDTTLTPDLIAEGQARDLVRHIQELRKTSGLDVTDRILLQISTDDDNIKNAISIFEKYICAETLARYGNDERPVAGSQSFELDNKTVRTQIWPDLQ